MAARVVGRIAGLEEWSRCGGSVERCGVRKRVCLSRSRNGAKVR